MRNRHCISSDSGALVELILELAQYKTLSDNITRILNDIQKTLFYSSLQAKNLILKSASEIGGSQLFFYSYSAFFYQCGTYIENIYIRAKYLGNAYYKTTLKHICQLLVESLYLDWNKVSIDFHFIHLEAL